MSPSPITLRSCMANDANCCTGDAACTQGSAGRCVPNPGSPCGGPAPFGNLCIYPACVADADCLPARPAGATVAVCVPPGAFGNQVARCIYGGCRTDADCVLQTGGRCQYGDAATHNGMCDLRQVFFCTYPSDPCQAYATGCSTPQLCLPNETYQGRHCGMGPPQYP